MLYTTFLGLPSDFGWFSRRCYCQSVSPIAPTLPFNTDGVSQSLIFSKVMKFKVPYITCPAVCYQSCFSEHRRSQSASRASSLTVPYFFPATPRGPSREHYEQHSHHSVFLLPFYHMQTAANKPTHCLCAISNAYYQILRKHTEH